MEDTVSAGAAMQTEATASRKRCHSELSNEGEAVETGAGGGHRGSKGADEGDTVMGSGHDGEGMEGGGGATEGAARDSSNGGARANDTGSGGDEGATAVGGKAAAGGGSEEGQRAKDSEEGQRADDTGNGDDGEGMTTTRKAWKRKTCKHKKRLYSRTRQRSNQRKIHQDAGKEPV